VGAIGIELCGFFSSKKGKNCVIVLAFKALTKNYGDTMLFIELESEIIFF
jgi:hypothetical protein